MTNEKNYSRELHKLGERIRYFRELRGLSQEALGFKAGLHRNYISMVELAQKNPSYTTLLKLADALTVNIVLLITEEIN